MDLSTKAHAWRVVALYRFFPVADPQALRDRLLLLCRDTGIRGTLIVAPEGLNGTLAGTSMAIDALITELNRLEGFEGAFIGKQACWVGNPVRADIAAIAEPVNRYARHQGGLRVLIVGGSQGALVLNQDLPELLLAVLGRDIQVRHQCGAGRTAEAAPIYDALGMNAQVSEFIDDMAEAYGWADLVICRAGALTVAEVAAAGVAALFIPLPTAVDDHQTLNARWLSDRGAALLLPQRELSAATLAATLKPVAERGALSQMAQRAREQAVVDSAERAATLCEEVANGR